MHPLVDERVRARYPQPCFPSCWGLHGSLESQSCCGGSKSTVPEASFPARFSGHDLEFRWPVVRIEAREREERERVTVQSALNCSQCTSVAQAGGSSCNSQTACPQVGKQDSFSSDFPTNLGFTVTAKHVTKAWVLWRKQFSGSMGLGCGSRSICIKSILAPQSKQNVKHCITTRPAPPPQARCLCTCCRISHRSR